MASISKIKNKKGVSFRARVRVVGYPHQHKTFVRKKDANEWAINTESKIRANKIMPSLEAKKHSVNDLIKRYLDNVKINTPHQYDRKKSHLSRFKQEIGFKLLSKVNKSDFTEIVELLSQEKNKKGKVRKQSTVARYLSTMNHCYEFCVNDIEWAPENPIKKLKKPKESPPKTRFLEPEELGKLVSSANDVHKRLADLILVLVFTGMRVGEALGIKVKDFDVEKHAIILEKTKNKQIRRVSIFGIAYDILKGLVEKNKIRGKSWQPFGGNTNKNYQKQRRKLLKALKLAKIKSFGFHGLRHTTASYLSMDGAQLQDVAEILGHSSIKMASRYSHLMEKYTKQKVKNLSENVINEILKPKTKNIGEQK